MARPNRVDRVIDLGGGYALPPFGEAHNHNFSGPWELEALVKRYLHAGVFYLQIPANVPEYRDAIASALNTPSSVDVTFANGVITGPRGHPIALYEDILRAGYYATKAGVQPRGWFEGKSYHVLSTAVDLDASLNSAQQRDANGVAFVRQFQAANLRLLKNAGVTIAVGTDNIEDVGAGEFLYLASLDVFTPGELLRLWSEATPQAIFPNRQIGRIAPGYEASFIILAGNPLDDLKATGEIVRWFKQGTELLRQ